MLWIKFWVSLKFQYLKLFWYDCWAKKKTTEETPNDTNSGKYITKTWTSASVEYEMSLKRAFPKTFWFSFGNFASSCFPVGLLEFPCLDWRLSEAVCIAPYTIDLWTQPASLHYGSANKYMNNCPCKARNIKIEFSGELIHT